MTATPTDNLAFQNFFQATLTADITASDTDIFLDTIPNGTEGFLVIEPDSATKREVIFYQSKTATKVVCPSAADGRGQDDTSATTHTSGATVIMAPVAGYFEYMKTLFTTTPQGWTSLAGSVTTVTPNGNRSYTLDVNTDYTSIISPGTRLKTTRTVAAPTQCTSLNGTSQYWVKTSPNKLTFTDDFTVSAWIKLTSYADAGIVSRYNGTSGWGLYTLSTGQIVLFGRNAGGANYSQVQSYQAIPLNKWVHITAQLDMSAFTATSTTSYVMIDGVDVPAQVVRGGTNPTALVQAGNLEVGTYNAGAFFPGKIAQVAVFNAKVTQATIRGYISQGFAGTETSVASAYSFDGSANDLNTTTPNNLTAQASAAATNADSPFGVQANGTVNSTTDYGIVMSVASGQLVVQVPEGNTIPSSGGVSAVAYSMTRAPFGFPGDKGRWRILAQSNSTNATVNVGSLNTWGVGIEKITVPIGAWELGYALVFALNSNAGGIIGGYITIHNSAPTNGVYGAYPLTSRSYSGASVTDFIVPASKSTDIKISSQTTYSLYGALSNSGGSANFSINGAQGPTLIYADNGYL